MTRKKEVYSPDFQVGDRVIAADQTWLWSSTTIVLTVVEMDGMKTEKGRNEYRIKIEVKLPGVAPFKVTQFAKDYRKATPAVLADHRRHEMNKGLIPIGNFGKCIAAIA